MVAVYNSVQRVEAAFLVENENHIPNRDRYNAMDI